MLSTKLDRLRVTVGGRVRVDSRRFPRTQVNHDRLLTGRAKASRPNRLKKKIIDFCKFLQTSIGFLLLLKKTTETPSLD